MSSFLDDCDYYRPMGSGMQNLLSSIAGELRGILWAAAAKIEHQTHVKTILRDTGTLSGPQQKESKKITFVRIHPQKVFQ